MSDDREGQGASCGGCLGALFALFMIGTFTVYLAFPAAQATYHAVAQQLGPGPGVIVAVVAAVIVFLIIFFIIGLIYR